MKSEVKIRFQGLNPHPLFQVAKLEHKTIYIVLFESCEGLYSCVSCEGLYSWV